MNDLQTALNEYLRVRRTLGFKLRDEGTVLPQFLRFLKEKLLKRSRLVSQNLRLYPDPMPLCSIHYLRHRIYLLILHSG